MSTVFSMSAATIPPLRSEDDPAPSGYSLRSLAGSAATMVLSAALTIAALLLVESALPNGEWGAGTVTLLVVGLIPMLAAGIAAHEAGHLLAGRLVGFRFALFLLGPVKAYREGDRVRWGLNTTLVFGGGGALTAPVPGELHDLRRRYRWMVLGGPLATVATGGAALAAYAALGATPAGILCLYFVALSAALAMSSGIPSEVGGMPSDGARLIRLAPGRAGAEQEGATLALSALTLLGHRPAEWDPEVVALVEAPAAGQTGALAAYFAYQHAMDTGREQAAGTFLQRVLSLLSTLPAPQRPMMTLEAAYFEAMVRGDAAAARRWLERSPPSPLVEPHERLRAEAAVLLAEGRREEALARAAEAREALGRSLLAGAPAMVEHDLRVVEQRASLTHSLSR